VLDEFLPWFVGPGRALDVGCGSGGLTIALAQLGWEVEGVEWDPQAAERARITSGRVVRLGDFRQLDLPVGVFDLIVLNHVFEHFDAPCVALGRVAELLSPRGRAVFVYPNPGSLGARRFGEHWFPWEVPRHLVLPPMRALVKEASKRGLVPACARTTARGAANFSALSRAYRDGEIVNEWRPALKLSDRTFGLMETGLIWLGAAVGEEIVLSFAKDLGSKQG
jgi:SAM-dependent methyltransferase